MVWKNPFKDLSTGKIFIFVIALIILTQVISLLISSLFKSVPVLKTGFLLILFSVGLTIIFLAQVVFKGSFDRNDFLGLILIGTITVLMFVYGGKFFPQIFSFIDSSALESAKNLQSILNLP